MSWTIKTLKYHFDSRLREKKICSRLKDGMCEKKIRFKSGHYELSVTAIDEAGNSVGKSMSFDI